MRLLTLFSLLILSACGFSPVYGTHSHTQNASSNAKAQLSNIAISIIPNREGQFLRNALMDRFYTSGIPTSPRYTLTISPIQENIYNFDITVESEATRRQLKLSAKMVLIDNETKQNVLTRNLLSIASHNVLESEFSTIVTEQSARENALHDLARQVERQLTLYLTR